WPGSTSAKLNEGRFAMTIPLPTVRAPKPGCAAIAVLFMTFTMFAAVNDGWADQMRAAMAAAVGAAAEVPAKPGPLGQLGMLNPGTADCPQSAAVRSTLGRVKPPFVPKRKFPGVSAVPLGWKKILRGPSELYHSGD